MTKSACTTADVTVWNGIAKRAYTECDAWRQTVLDRIAAEKPALVVVANSRTYQVMVDGVATPISEVPGEWDAAPGPHPRAPRASRPARGRDRGYASFERGPAGLPFGPPGRRERLRHAVREGRRSGLHGARGRRRGVGRAGWVDPTAWVCRTDPCPVVFGRFLIFRDQHHLTATYSRALATQLSEQLPSLAP